MHSVKVEHARFKVGSVSKAIRFEYDYLVDQAARAMYDTAIYKGNNYKNYVNIRGGSMEKRLAQIKTLIQNLGGVAVTGAFVINGELRYLKLMFSGGRRSAPYTGQANADKGQVNRVGKPRNIPAFAAEKFPQFGRLGAMLFDVSEGRDPGERENLISKRMPEAIQSALNELLGLYANATANTVLDVFVRRGLTPDIHLLEPTLGPDGSSFFWGMPITTGRPYLCIYDEI